MSINQNNPEPSDKALTVKVTISVASIALAVWVLSFLVLPVLDVSNLGIDSWSAICRAVGIGSAAPQPAIATVPASKTAWTEDTLRTLRTADPAKGLSLAQDSCVGCHDANGLSADPASIPSITGLSARAIFKQLRDMRDGQRQNDAMAPLVAELTDAQLADLAAYYSQLPSRNHDIRALQEPSAAATRLATKGDISRALPACEACHGATSGGPLEAPVLTGQYPDYVAAQLKGYATGARKNDLYGRMRRVAGKLTDQEIADLSAYYNAPQ